MLYVLPAGNPPNTFAGPRVLTYSIPAISPGDT